MPQAPAAGAASWMGNIANAATGGGGGGGLLSQLLPSIIGGVGNMAGAGIKALSETDPAAVERAKIEASRTASGFEDFGAGLENVPNSDRAKVLSLRNSRRPILFNPSSIR